VQRSLLSKDTIGQLLATGGDMVAATCLFRNAMDPEEKMRPADGPLCWCDLIFGAVKSWCLEFNKGFSQIVALLCWY
jgi:hypothetical protein